MRYENAVANKLIAKKKTLCLAESCTGGLLAHKLTNIPGSSQFLMLGLVVYSNEAKMKFLRVPKKIIQKYGAVSKPAVEIMAKNIRKIISADFGVAITGIAGPTGQTKNKPIGLTYIAVSSKNKIRAQAFHFKGSRISIKTQAANSALRLLLKLI